MIFISWKLLIMSAIFSSYNDLTAGGQFEFAGKFLVIPTLANLDLLNLLVSVMQP
ncbi:hypothetical protein BH11BAC4_BH11BAC4_22750 [soil metagenome]